MDNPSPNERSNRAKGSRETLPPKTFKGNDLTPAKKLRSPVRSNESSASMPTPIPALVVDLKKPITTTDDNNEDDDEDDGDDEETSDSGSSTPRASQHAYGLRSPLPAYATTTTGPGSGAEDESPSTPRASRHSYGLEPTLPARYYDAPAEYHYHNRRHRRNESSISSTTTIRPPRMAEQSGHSEQEVLDAMINDLSRNNQQQKSDQDDVVHERGSQLKPARSLRARDYYEDDGARRYYDDTSTDDDDKKGKGREGDA